MNFFLYALKFVVVCYALILIGLYSFQRKLIYSPSKEQPSLEGFKGVYTEVKTQAKEGKLTHWYSKQGDPFIIVFHGNAGGIEGRGGKFKFLADQGYSVLLAGYPGYDLNPGKPTEKNLIDSSKFVLEWFLKERGISSKEVILFGESLGSGVALALASQYPVKAVVLDGAFSSVTDIGKSVYPFVPVRWILKDKWDSESRIHKVKAPLLFIHSKEDSTVPFRFGKKIFLSANEPKKHIWLEGGDHESNLDNDSVKKSIIDFIHSVL